ncbi:unnamed protein product [Rotaria magnacalcarata]|uniref:Uncharacterized protein n=2 Tax=Rotaria magnacalcarata TaxID=392030 RepID=A0A816QL39_9BILA|nr:unnamed protein product [Rotaria magnacalcarata]
MISGPIEDTWGYRMANKKHIREAWDSVVQHFREELEVSDSSIDFGSILELRLDDIARSFGNLESHTLIHGDFKVTNILIDDNEIESQVYAVDWQWFGVGNIAIDVAYFIATSVNESTIENSIELVHYYFQVLSDNGVTYQWERFWKAYQVCWVDFFIYTVVGKWSKMETKDIDLYKQEEKDGLHLRSYPHMKNLFKQSEKFIQALNTSSMFQFNQDH